MEGSDFNKAPYLDNGFTSAEGMAASHRIMIDGAVHLLTGQSGKILDLGCGNGRLVYAIARRLKGVIPCGVECMLDRACRGRAMLEGAGGRLHAGDIFSQEHPWFDRESYLLTILMIGRLLEVSAQCRHALIADIERHSKLLLLYTYGDSLSMSDSAGRLLESTFPHAARLNGGAELDSLPRLWVHTFNGARFGGA